MEWNRLGIQLNIISPFPFIRQLSHSFPFRSCSKNTRQITKGKTNFQIHIGIDFGPKNKTHLIGFIFKTVLFHIPGDKIILNVPFLHLVIKYLCAFILPKTLNESSKQEQLSLTNFAEKEKLLTNYRLKHNLLTLFCLTTTVFYLKWLCMSSYFKLLFVHPWVRHDSYLRLFWNRPQNGLDYWKNINTQMWLLYLRLRNIQHNLTWEVCLHIWRCLQTLLSEFLTRV